MYKKDLALNNLPWLIYHKTKPNQTSYVFVRIYKLISDTMRLMIMLPC